MLISTSKYLPSTVITLEKPRKYILVTFACPNGNTLCFLLKKVIFCSKLLFSSKTYENVYEYFRKLKYFIKTQGKNSFFRQVHYPTFLRLGRKEKPVLGTQAKGLGDGHSISVSCFFVCVCTVYLKSSNTLMRITN